MGVPKFARFICERYPCILELLNEYEIPEFDNLYLDMNGIIHCCSHPNDADAHFRITEETIFKNIFHYVEILFRTIKPQKLFFMAVDGVAPRAKINQQRGRRFRAAKDAELVEARARAKGEKIPEESRFDSNCITPGTLFMSKLTEQLKYFITYKISTDKLWQNCDIILSGPEVPGEGEHKIMDFIRYLKAKPDHNPNTRHCLYGLDADLIILSLCTHEPHFAVLREEVKYGKNAQKCIIPEKTQFCLLHTSLLREYLGHEFESIKDKLPFPYDVEKIIDDWILMGFLVGNDFIPHLPNLHIANGALPLLYHAYMEVLPTLGGYINEAGRLNLERFELFMERLAVIDVENFAERLADLRFFEGKTGRRPNENERTSYRKSQDSPEPIASPKIKKKDLSALIQSTEEMLLGHSDEEEPLDSDSDNDMYNLEFLQHKRDYYMNKFDYENVDANIMRSQAEAYVTAIQWNLHYYYDGCRSWSWYYPHHYAPYISDIKGFKDLKFNFEMGKPFLPFQQLLAVLPAASKSLLPEAYQGLLTEEESPIIDYYPAEFRTDLNEKKHEWEAIVLIPFINEKKLIDAMEPHNSQLTPEEVKRNQHGPMVCLTYTPENMGIVKAPDYFPSIESHATIKIISPREIDVPEEKLVKGLAEGVKLGVYFSGFPTMHHIEHTAHLEKSKVKVFEQPSRGENMILTIVPKETPPIEELALKILGKVVFVKWPHLLEAHVVGVSNNEKKFTLIDPSFRAMDNMKKEDLTSPGITQWKFEARAVASSYKSRYGVEVGETKILIHARPLSGHRCILISEGRLSLEKEWSDYPSIYAYQAIVEDIEVGDDGENDNTLAHKNIENIYTPGSMCFMLGHPHYGAMGEVMPPGFNKKTGRVKVAMFFTPKLYLNNFKREQGESRMQYVYGRTAARRLGMSPHLLSRITGSIFVAPGHHENSVKKQQNIGLNLKSTKKNEELPGYTRRAEGQWLYSLKSIDLIRSYMEKYPDLFERLANNIKDDTYKEDDLFPDGIEELATLVKWMENQPFRSIAPRNCDCEGLDPDIIEKIEAELDKYVKYESLKTKTVAMQVKPHLLYKSELNAGNIPPDPEAKHCVFDRVISVKQDSCVPLGYKGIIVGIEEKDDDINNTSYDVLFDKPFIGALSFDGSANTRRYKLLISEFINISHGIRVERDHKKQQSTTESPKHTKPSAFASFNNYENFLPVFSKNSQETPQPQQIKNKPPSELEKQTNSPARKNTDPKSADQPQKHQSISPSTGAQKSNSVQRPIAPSSPHSPITVQQHSEETDEWERWWEELTSQRQNSDNSKDRLAPPNKIVEGQGPIYGPAPPHYLGPNVSSQIPPEVEVFWKKCVAVLRSRQIHPTPTPLPGEPEDSVKATMKHLMNSTTPSIPSPLRMELQTPPVIPPAVDSSQDPSAFLKAVLKIDDNPNSSSSQSSSISATSGTKPFTFPTPPAPPTSTPALVQQMFDHARQANKKENISYCTLLLNHFQMMGTGIPRYFYSSKKNLIRAHIILPDLTSFVSDFCSNHELAAQNAASKACKDLNLDPTPIPPLQQQPKVRNVYGDVLAPDAWVKMNPPPMNIQPMMSPRPFPNVQKPPPRFPVNWNQKMPQQPPGFTQMRPIHINQMRPSGPSIVDTKPEIKQSTPFVPLQAQKKTRNRKPHDSTLNPREEIPKDEGHPPKQQKPKIKNNPPKVVNVVKIEKPIKQNEAIGIEENLPVQKIQKAPRTRKSRIAANFGSSPATSGGDIQK